MAELGFYAMRRCSLDEKTECHEIVFAGEKFIK
jgi:hypothetical protein